uniref:Dirigent protein n=1 Tax=Oryza glumipatula TaxID=40148 RepID=A0A0E0BQK4_9ORYZ
MASYYEITSRGALIKGREFNFSNLYLYHIYNSSEPNQQQIIDNVSSTAMGGLTVNNWTVYDGVGSDATLGIFEEDRDWAIVGGTGEFAMASGVIKKTVYERTPEGTIIELTIRGFCPDF